MLISGYLWLAIFVAALLWRNFEPGKWAEYAVSSLPTIMGFTLAAAAVLTSVGGETFRERLALVNQNTDQPAPIKEVITDFVVVIMVQVGIYLYSMVFIARPFPSGLFAHLRFEEEYAAWVVNFVLGAVGSVWLVYSVVLTLGLAFSLLAVLELYVRDVRRRHGAPPTAQSEFAQVDDDSNPA